MSGYTDRIKPTDNGIITYLDNLLNKKYQIPTFQREVVWEKENVKKLWDSIYKFYPLGSILVWRTNVKLQNHRTIGGHIISDDFSTNEYKYILDGQQRTTSLLTSLYGGRIKNKDNFDPVLYIDLTVEQVDEIDDESYKKRFLFWDEIDDRNGELMANTGRKRRYDQGLIIKIQDIRTRFGDIERKLIDNHYSDYDHQYRVQLRKIRDILDNYRISFIELRGIQVAEVCQIFERINQAGVPLNIFDIVVAKTFRPENKEVKGFYLRDLFESFRKNISGNYTKLDDITLLQMVSVVIGKSIPEAHILNITERYLNDIKSEHIEAVWEDTKTAMLKLFDFFDNILHLKGPELVPFRYFYMTLLYYFYKNSNPDYDFLTKYFWYYSFHNDDLLSNTTHLWNHITIMENYKSTGELKFDRFLIDKNKLRNVLYSSRGRISRAILSLYANQEPKDWANPDRNVVSEVYYLLTDKPNLHHIFPLGYINQNKGSSVLETNSLINIAYLTQMTNLKISDKNPVQYMKDYDTPKFITISKSHLLPDDLIEWARMDSSPENALDIFIEKRLDIVINLIKEKLNGISFEIIDTK